MLKTNLNLNKKKFQILFSFWEEQKALKQATRKVGTTSKDYTSPQNVKDVYLYKVIQFEIQLHEYGKKLCKRLVISMSFVIQTFFSTHLRQRIRKKQSKILLYPQAYMDPTTPSLTFACMSQRICPYVKISFCISICIKDLLSQPLMSLIVGLFSWIFFLLVKFFMCRGDSILQQTL